MIPAPPPPFEIAVAAVGGIDVVVSQTTNSTSDRGLGSLVVSGLFFVFGLAMIYGGFDAWRKKRLIQDTPTESVRSIAAGRTELNGIATPTPTEGTVEQPFTDGACLYADWEVEEYHPDDDGSDWVTIDSGEIAVPFELDDGTGSIPVAASTDTQWEISDEHRTQTKVGDQASPPAAIRSFLETNADLDVGDDGFLFDDTRRYTQEVLPPQEDVYVFGMATEREGASGTDDGRLVMKRDDGSGRFLISDMAEPELTETLSKRAPIVIAIGLGMGVIGLYGVLWSVGVA